MDPLNIFPIEDGDIPLLYIVYQTVIYKLEDSYTKLPSKENLGSKLTTIQPLPWFFSFGKKLLKVCICI